jgi:nicotinamide phosphoribosyltransferase
MNPLTQIDFYKADHRSQYPADTELVYSNWTPRSIRLGAANMAEVPNEDVVCFGLSHFIQDYLVEEFNRGFFQVDRETAVIRYKRRLDTSLGPDAVSCDHIRALHDLGYLPLRIDALPEGTLVPAGVPMLTVENTDRRFFWLTNYLETVFSQELWKPSTTATIAFKYRQLLEYYAAKTGSPAAFVKFQGHDFSARGMSGRHDAANSGQGHLLSFFGTDTVAAIDELEKYYGANAETELIGCSVPATEHSVMCFGGEEDEFETFKRLITQVYPSGIVSIVSDTWDYWQVVTGFLPRLKDIILARTGNPIGNKVVIRPDSGDPVKIIIGDHDAPVGSPEYKGSIECLWEIFGGTITATGHKLLSEKIGLIYGDSITLKRAQEILSGLAAKGFASGNVVLGIGSYTYQHITRDTYGFAMKATGGLRGGKEIHAFKKPKTDSGSKNSAKGFLAVRRNEVGHLVLVDCLAYTAASEDTLLETVFFNGKQLVKPTLAEIRARVEAALPVVKV